MLDFTVESPRRLFNEFASLAGPGKTTRVAGDRRSAQPGVAPTAGVTPKRRRHDNLGCGKPVPLQNQPGSAGCRAGVPRR